MKHPFRASFSFWALSIASIASAGAQTTLYGFHGDSTKDRLGQSVSQAGDVNGDGTPDYILGVRWDDLDGFGNPGSARVISGKDGAILHLLGGELPYEIFGWSVGSTGDINQDGFSDLVVTSPFDDWNGSESGTVRVFSGKDGATLFTVHGDSPLDQLGYSASNAGDLNGDGFADFVAGAPQFYIPIGPGYIRAYSGQDGSILWTVAGEIGGQLNGAQVLGLVLGAAGDMNADGFDDVIAGLPFYPNPMGVTTGIVRVYSGKDGALLYEFSGDEAADRFGQSVAGVRDVNLDGFPDIVVGAPQNIPGITNGYVRVHSGKDGSILHNFVGEPEGNFGGDLLGWSVSAAGDVNGDQHPDILAGAHGNRSAKVFSGLDGALLLTVNGEAPYFGFSVAGVGDLDGDGKSEILVGSHNESKYGDEAGAAWVYSAASIDCGATVTDSGLGCQGSEGEVPHLSLTGCAASGSLALSLTNGLGGAPGLLFAGFESQVATLKGCPFLVGQVFGQIPLTLPGGGSGEGWMSLSTHLPPGIPSGVKIVMQAFLADSGGSMGISGTNSVGLTFH